MEYDRFLTCSKWKKDHFISDCFKLKRKWLCQTSKTCGVACAAVGGDQGYLVSLCSVTPEVQGSTFSCTEFIRDYKPCLS